MPNVKGIVFVNADGRIGSRGSAPSFGPVPRLWSPVVAVELTRSGQGCYLVTARGRVLTLGDAVGHGSVAPSANRGPIVGFDARRNGSGYALVQASGRVHLFGSAASVAPVSSASRARITVRAVPAVGIVETPKELGYWIVYRDGKIRHIGAGRSLRSVGATDASVVDAN